MSLSTPSASTRPYLIRALYEWCADNGFTPFIAVSVDASVSVPNEYVRDGEIVLNISMDATSGLQIGNDAIEFKGRFGGVARDIYIPVHRVMAIYARENGQGMAFPMQLEEGAALGESSGHHEDAPVPSAPTRPTVIKEVKGVTKGQQEASTAEDKPKPPTGGGRPTLTRIK